MECKTVAGFGAGLIAGAIIGGVIALLYAPRSGKMTRQLIKDTAADVVDTLKETAGEVMDTAMEGASEANRQGHAAFRELKS